MAVPDPGLSRCFTANLQPPPILTTTTPASPHLAYIFGLFFRNTFQSSAFLSNHLNLNHLQPHLLYSYLYLPPLNLHNEVLDRLHHRRRPGLVCLGWPRHRQARVWRCTFPSHQPLNPLNPY